MTRFDRPRWTMTAAAAALLAPLGAGDAMAQMAGYAIEISPPADVYASMRIGARVYGPTAEPASGFVRGCQGHLMAEADGVPYEVTGRLDTLAFTGAGEGLVSMVLGTPDGLYRCALADDRGLVSTQLAGVDPGRYMVWLGGDEGAQIDARLIASNQPISAIDLFGLDVTSLGEPRIGRFAYRASAESGRQELASGAVLYPEETMRPLDSNNCWGYSRLDAADAVVTLDEASGTVSFFAMSQRDLTMAVVTPSGRVLCNDDTWQLMPAVTVGNAEAGDYHVFVGGYSQGGSDVFDLFASAGAPAFSNATVDLGAEPRAGRVSFDINAAGQGQLLATAPLTSTDPMEMLPIGQFCPGFVDISAPDLVLSLDAPQPMISLYARSSADLVLAVRGPDGSWLCNDDDMELNPAVRVQGAQAGEYLVYVGSYSPGATGTYNLYASMGAPNWQDAMSGPASAPDMLNTDAEPAVARIPFGPETQIDPRLIFDIEPSRIEAFGLGDGCAGFITPTRPDVVIEASEGLPQLMVYVASDADGVLAIVAPDGQLFCNDDFEGLNPGVMIPNPMPGDYAVFAGTYGGNGGLATMGVTVAAPHWTMDREH